MNASSPDPVRRRSFAEAFAKPGRIRTWSFVVLASIVAIGALVEVTVSGPIVSVRWREEFPDAVRQEMERRYSLIDAAQRTPTTWRYRLDDWSRENVTALVRDPAVDDTHDIDRATMTVAPPSIEIGMRPLPFPFNTDRDFQDLSQLFQPQSLCALVAALGLLLSANGHNGRRRRSAAIAFLVVFAASAFAVPLDPTTLHMGDSALYVGDRATFEAYMGVQSVRFEAHLSYAIAGRLYAIAGPGDDAPTRVLVLMMRAATAWFVVCALAIGYVERWSPQVVRYLGLSLLAPAALLLFGYRELGHLSLNVATFPLLLRGLRAGSPHLEAAAALAGLGAALHGFGLLALAGAVLAACVSAASPRDRLRYVLTTGSWGTAAYLGWVAVYVIVLELPISSGHTEVMPWRPWFTDRFAEGRVNAAIFSAIGARDIAFTAWVVGAPLFVVAVSAWRRYGADVRVALAYAAPSVVFSILFWPVQGIGVEMDLLVAAFPALYGLAWICAADRRHATIAAMLLATAHLAFWRILFDDRFMN